MLKPSVPPELLYGQQPRKRIKVNVALDQNYNEFKGDFIEDPPIYPHDQKRDRNDEKMIKFQTFEAENSRNHNIYEEIKKGERKIRKINDVCQVKLEEKEPKTIMKTKKQEEKAQPKKEKNETDQKKEVEQAKPAPKAESKKKIKKQVTGLSNWSKFITQATSPQQSSRPTKTPPNQAVAIDCEFVKGGDEELLARISIVSDKGECLLDSYVKPEKQITDYLTNITGMSYLHIKNAPKAAEVLEKAKKIMYNKILVGHTVWKDLEVCGLQNWKGWKTLVDISEFKEFKEKTGKLISLKNLSLKYLGRSIQEGRHSSVEDSLATIDLFKIRKMEMLKQCKVIL